MLLLAAAAVVAYLLLSLFDDPAHADEGLDLGLGPATTATPALPPVGDLLGLTGGRDAPPPATAPPTADRGGPLDAGPPARGGKVPGVHTGPPRPGREARIATTTARRPPRRGGRPAERETWAPASVGVDPSAALRPSRALPTQPSQQAPRPRPRRARSVSPTPLARRRRARCRPASWAARRPPRRGRHSIRAPSPA
ncbi:hypothetical protein [Phytohabitans houttuyneae]|uniref:hypothetical protein n=1 Tax=Phytohabitans houttuyneae TaxID=1076126 RepID=UPI001565783C|nr:hypothetical protein [Phytohabitans houttuyneae]